jgi:hypothetical protein
VSTIGKPPEPDGAGHDEQTEPDEPEFSIARSNALAPLLLLFIFTVLGIVLAIVRDRPYVPPVGAPADRAFSPADFPAVLGTQDLAAAPETGLEGGGTALFPIPAPPFTEGLFPCTTCHADLTPDPERRELPMHEDIVLHHDEEHRWCLDCHDLNDRDHLRLASGVLVPFTESYRLCGQCHGTQYRDWRSGIHGKRTGYWDGSKRYLLCVHCHNPHHPHFVPLRPLPPPVRPQLLQFDAQGAAGRGGRREKENGRETE